MGARGEVGEGQALPAAPGAPAAAEAARRRAAVELATRHRAAVMQTARRYSLCAADADDAYQRTLEILLTKAPLERGDDLLAWSRTVAKHEALAVRRNRERLLGTTAVRGEDEGDPVARIASGEDSPDERLERHEDVARSREALHALKPAELRALTLLGEGYTYAEIAEITGFSRTKINRSLAEGRERFRRFVSRSEDGRRCMEMAPVLSRFCDGETSAEETAAVREHLRACGGCRATVRAYRTAPARIAALAPGLPLLPASRSLLERAQELALGIQSRLPGLGGDASLAAAGGARGAGTAALAKLLAVCAGTVGGTAACVAAGVVPAPADLSPERFQAPRIERVSPRALAATAPAAVPADPAATAGGAPERRAGEAEAAAEPAQVEAEAGAVEYEPAAVAPVPAPAPSPAPPPAPAPAEASTPAGAAGEFGP